MPRALWKGAINFGLIHIPVKMYKATSPKDIRFRELHDADASPLKQKKVCALDGKEVSSDHIVKGFEIAPDKFVIIQKKELEALEAAEAHTIDIESFVDLGEVDPVFFENSYYVVPEKGAGRAYSLLLAAMKDSNRAAIGRLVMRQKQQLAIIRASGRAVALSTLYYSDEVIAQDKLDELPADAAPDQRELAMAKQLIESLADEFRPDKYQDEYRKKVGQLIEAKAEGQEWKAPVVKPETANVIDLVSALQESLKAAKKQDDAPAKKPAAKKATVRTVKKRMTA